MKTVVFIAGVIDLFAAMVISTESTIETNAGIPKVERKQRQARAIPSQIFVGNVGCRPVNTSCTDHSDCCGGESYTCRGRKNDGGRVCKKCKDVGEDCSGDIRIDSCCQLFVCEKGKCVCKKDGEKCENHNSCCGSGICIDVCQPCMNANKPCEDDNHCCNGRCNREDRVCYCTEEGPPCASSLDCCRGFKCMNRICSNCMRVTGPCGHDEECCSKNCSNGVCDCKRKIS